MNSPAGAILAGGEASRYAGAAKGLLETRTGVTIIGTLIEEMTASGLSEVIVVANDAEPYRGFGRKVVRDLRRDIGPLAGIEAALAYYATRSESVLFCPCDLPGMTRREISTLASAYAKAPGGVVVAETMDFFWHPLCAVVHNDLLAEISRAIDDGVRRPRQLWRDLGAVPVRFDDETAFFNVNTPEDMDRWRTLEGGAR